jgi:hypothetical protein
MTRLKLAELTSGVGAVVLGVGVGALFPEWFARAATLITVTGLALHGFGMWDKHRLEDGRSEDAAWVGALYWACWALLGALVVILLVRR